MAAYYKSPIAFFGGDKYLQASEILQEGIEKEWSYDRQCFVYRFSNRESKKRKENLESIISYYYKLR